MKFLARKKSLSEPLRSDHGCAALISAILDQAFSDALSLNSSHHTDAKGARKFIDADNKLFAHYCSLLGWEPEFVAKKMQEEIRKGILRPLKELRE